MFIFFSQSGDRCIHVQNLLHLFGKPLQLGEEAMIVFFRYQSQFFGGVQRKQVQHRQLRRIAFGGGHGNLRTRPGVERMVGQLCDGAAHYVDNGKCFGSALLTFLHSRNGIGCFAGLGQDDQKRGAIDLRITVAQLTCQLHYHRQAAQLFNGILSGAACIIGGAAGCDHDFPDLLQFLRRIVKSVQMNLFLLKSRCQSRFDCTGLLHDFFEHEMVVAAFFRRLNAPCDAADLFADRCAGAVKHADPIRRQGGKFSVVQIDGVSRISNQSSHIRGEKVFADSNA